MKMMNVSKIVLSFLIILMVVFQAADSVEEKYFEEFNKLKNSIPQKFDDKNWDKIMKGFESLLTKYPQKEEIILIELSHMNEYQYKYLKAIEIHKLHLKKYPKSNNKLLIMQDLANYYRCQYAIDKTEIWIDNSIESYLDVLKEPIDDNAKCSVYSEICECYLLKKDYKGFVINSENILKYLPEKFPKLVGLYCQALNNLGRYYSSLKEFDKAQEYYQIALNVSKEYYKAPYTTYGNVVSVESIEKRLNALAEPAKREKFKKLQDLLDPKTRAEFVLLINEKIAVKENLKESNLLLFFETVEAKKDELGKLVEIKSSSSAESLNYSVDSYFVKTKDKWNLKDLEFVEKGTSKYKKATK